MEEAFNWCFIGSGRLAKKVARSIIKSGRHKIVSVYSRRFDKCAEFAEKFGSTAYGSALEAVNADGVDGVYIVTPHDSHYKYCILSVQSGKAVLCEKPFTVDFGSANEIFALAEEKKVYVAEAMWTWFAPVANKIKEWLDNGEFGEIQSASAKWRLPFGYAPRVTDPNRAGGALLDIGVYSVAYAYRLFGKPIKIECKGKVSRGIDRNEHIRLEFSTGAVFTASISIGGLDIIEKLKITGSKAKITLPFFHCANKVKLVRKNGKNKVYYGRGDYLNEFDTVACEIKSGITESRFVSRKDTLDIMEILDECRRQLNLVYPFEKCGE